MNPWLPQFGPAGLSLALLLAGHFLGDFVIQTERMAREKSQRFPVLIEHVLFLGLTQILCYLPLLNQQALLGLGVLTLAHGLIDWLKIQLDRRAGGPQLATFTLDQAFHLLSLLLVWLWIREDALSLTSAADVWLTQGAVVVAGLAFCGRGGAFIVASLLQSWMPSAANQDSDRQQETAAFGRFIGMMERWLIFLLILGNQWGAVGFVVAAKSIARFKDLEQRVSSEYYLAGTLASLLVAVATGLTVRLLVL
ncbi:MAG: DUF3307 domain-containing protein [Planctomycetota bacterium]|nr:MAG: DUF3307 domain-containing protein [Planctomycetota bacterium]